MSNVYYFYFRGRFKSGKKTKGKILELSETAVRAYLKKQQIYPSKIRKRTPPFWVSKQHKLCSKDITLFSRQMATMLSAGLSLSESLVLIKNGVKKLQMRQIIEQIESHLSSGMAFAEALKYSCSLFDRFYCELISMGEQTGKLDEALERAAHYREKNEQLRSKMLKMMIYPSILFSIAMAVSIAMLLFVIPAFEAVFATFDAKLPWFTQKVLNLAAATEAYIFHWLLAIFMVIALGKKSIQKNPNVTLFISRCALSMPLIGNILTKAAIARFSHTLATTFNAGIPLLAGLSVAANTAKNPYLEQVIADIHKQTAGGKPLYLAISESGAFPDTMKQMLMIGEESGELDTMLHKIAVLYESQVDNIIENISKIVEPIIILILGLLIGSLVLAVYLPMFNLMGEI